MKIIAQAKQVERENVIEVKPHMEHTLLFQNYQVHYYIEGTGAPLLFLHGWPTNAQLWAAQVEALKANYKVITIDWLGFGQSDKPNNFRYSFLKKKAILQLLLSRLLKPKEQITLIAHDIGGPPALLWASENPKQVKRLILLNTVLYSFKSTLDQMSHVFFNTPLLKSILGSQFGLRQIMKTVSQSRSARFEESIRTILSAYEHLDSTFRLKTILEPMDREGRKLLGSMSQKFGALDCPKYLIIAKKDPLCFKHIQQLSQDYPNVPTYRLPDCGHYIPIDQPEALNAILLKILNEKA